VVKPASDQQRGRSIHPRRRIQLETLQEELYGSFHRLAVINSRQVPLDTRTQAPHMPLAELEGDR
jgi:hypothetical protein